MENVGEKGLCAEEEELKENNEPLYKLILERGLLVGYERALKDMKDMAEELLKKHKENKLSLEFHYGKLKSLGWFKRLMLVRKWEKKQGIK